MVKIVDAFSILNNGDPTFNSTNGSNIIDLCLFYGRIVSQNEHNLTTDEYVELFTGAPNRGHLPVLVDFIKKVGKSKREFQETTIW